MRKLGLIFGTGVIALVLFVIVAAGGLWFYAKSSKTEWNGEIALAQAPAPVTLTRDQWGVPHITGDTDEAVYFGLGYAHAQDRMFQMDLLRHVVQGRLAEIGGKPLAQIDAYIRTIGLYRAAQKAEAHLQPETVKVIEAYVAGINAYIETAPRPLAPELALLMHKPSTWTVADTIAINKIFAVGLSGDALGEALSARLRSVLDDEQLQQIRLTYPDDGPVVTAGNDKRQQARIANAVIDALPFKLPEGASNNWVVDGNWTQSGKPLLANDPHLGIWSPSVFYLAHMKLSQGNAIGATAPGMPFIVMGRSDHTAWGFTNARGDVQDLFIETVDPEDETKYLTPDGSQPFSERTETINVRFGSPQTVTIRETRHGPVLPADLGGLLGFENQLISISWTALHEDDTTLDAGIAIAGAKSVPELFEALKRFIVPQQNIVMADTSGNIGYLAPARLPVRRTPKDGWGPLGPGRLPMDGKSGDGDWIGNVPFEFLPQAINPAKGYVVTANNRNVPLDHPYFIASDWETPYRAARIEELIVDGGGKYTVQDFVDMQQDSLSVGARTLLPSLLAQVSASSDEATEALRLLRAWDYVMDRHQIAPLIYKEWIRQLSVRLYADELGAFFDGADRHDTEFLVTVFGAAEDDAEARAWCNNVQTDEAETCQQIASLALEDAIAYLSNRFGTDITEWTWGRAHIALHQHQPFGMVPVLKNVFDRTIPADGGPYTVYRANTSLKDKNAHMFLHGAAYRAVYDLADLEQSVYIINSGQSGNTFSPYYDNLVEPWRDGALIPMWTDPAKYEPNAVGVLKLVPAAD